MTQRQASADQELTRAFSERRQGLRAIARRAGDQDAEDVVQEAFLRVVQTSRRQDVRALNHLMSRIVRCVAIDRLRRRASRPEQAGGEAGELVADLRGDPERLLMGAQRLRRALSIIEQMPPRRRRVFLLHRIEELSYVQIARGMGVTVKAVEKHMRLALKQLAENDDR